MLHLYIYFVVSVVVGWKLLTTTQVHLAFSSIFHWNSVKKKKKKIWKTLATDSMKSRRKYTHKKNLEKKTTKKQWTEEKVKKNNAQRKMKNSA